MGIRMEKNKQTTVLHLEGDITIAMAAQLKDELIQKMGESGGLTISLDAVEDMDISCIQILCAANRSSEKQDKKLVLNTGKNTENIKQFLIESGYDPGGSCPESPCKRCLWKGDRR